MGLILVFAGDGCDSRDVVILDVVMTIARRGRHQMTVDGHELSWWVRRSGKRGCPDCDSLTIVIAAASRKGCVIQVGMPDPSGPDRPITPSLVSKIARVGLAAGWQPGLGSGTFTLPPGSWQELRRDFESPFA